MLASLLCALLASPDDSGLSEVMDPAARVEKVAGDFQFVEGPAWSPAAFLLFSDIPANKVLKLEADGKTSDFLNPSGGANGLAFDAEGTLYACQGGDRQLLRVARDGTRAVLASTYGGKKLNSPNDLALDPEGGLYFTDPRYGGNTGVEQEVMGVYYVPASGEVRRVIADLPRPNGILVGAGGKKLYVANPDQRRLHEYPILKPGELGPGKVLFHGDPELDGGGPDGMALDERGNLYATYKAVVVLDPEGKVRGRIPVPEHPANCKLGGADGKTLFITARTGLYRVPLRVGGIPLPPRGPAGGTAVASAPAGAGAGPFAAPRFRPATIDPKVGIGYGVAVADVDGDRKLDVALADKDVIVWYRNPGWEKSVIAEKLTPIDHVCLAARDLDGDGKAELAAGAGWNPNDTVGSGSVHYLIAPAERTAKWEPVKLHHEPTVHRMRWLRAPDGAWELAVVPLHGRGNKNGEGEGVRSLAYRMAADPKSSWKTELMDGTLHVVHNLEVVSWDDDPADEVLLAAREGVFLLDRGAASWERKQLAGAAASGAPHRGAGEVRTGRLPGGKRFIATIEPFHGNTVVTYTPPAGGAGGSWSARDLDATLNGGHALACGDLAGRGSDQVVAGWRLKDKDGKVGIRLYAPLDPEGKEWAIAVLDGGTMACEDLALADFNADGRLDIVAAGRDTHNLVVYWNEGVGG